MKDAQVGTDSHRTEIERSPETRLTSASSEQYDQDEPLTTKVVKVFKKRRIANPAPYDSDDSFEEQTTLDRGAESLSKTPNEFDSDIPRSDETTAALPTEISSIEYNARESKIQFDSEQTEAYRSDNPQGSVPHGFRLASGLAFIYMAIPPDGGYGWVVLCLSFLAQLIVDGIVFSIGILLPFISEEFNVSSAEVVLVGSIQIGCYFMGGAFSSALINSYGFRPVALIGVVISAASILTASFSTNLLMMIIFYSIIGGPGLSMIWVSSQLIIGYYFERYRPIASGFSCSGAGAGIFLFSITNSLLALSIGWRNTIRVQVILIVLIFFMALAYQEVAPTPVGVLRSDPMSTSSSNEYYGNFYVHNFLGEDVSSKRSHAVLETYEPYERPGRVRRWISRCSPCCVKKPTESDYRYPLSDDERSERNFVVRADPIQKEDLFYTGPADYDVPHNREQIEGKELELVGSQAHIQRAAYGLHNIHDYDSTDRDSAMPPDSEGNSPRSSPSPTPRNQVHRHKKTRKDKEKKRSWLGTKAMKAMNRLFDVHLLRSFEFRVLLASAFLYPMGFNIPFVYSKARTTIPTEYSHWIGPAIGATSFLVRILCGFVAYKLRGWTNYICGGGLMLGGIMVFVSAFYGSDLIWFQFVYGLLYGVAPAVFATLRALIYVRYLGLSKLTNAFGITALAMGLGVFIGTTFGGLLVDKTGGYTAPFAFAGLCITFSGVLKLILPAWIKHRNNRKMI
ncbi:uncharacterized protein LOC117783002 [Drosophila innubila]|uniref:uncharacterized protein LOC117783002 n=1 Tax=Drosophila innubila TaxID=198719 RepID=UPI00148D48BE|nr:uncharacterized protein LOC117783002 [Drosophila innubila]